MNEKGFTIIEMVVTIGIFTILSMGLMGLVGTLFSDSNKYGSAIANADQTRKLSIQMMQELRNTVAGSNGAYAIAAANAQELTFYSNVDGGTDIERVRYYLQSGQLRRGIVKQSGNPIVYTGAEVSTVVQRDVANGANPIFYYYDENFDDSIDSALTQPVSIPQVSYIKLNMTVLKKTSKNLTDSFTVTAGSSLRSLKNNLGD